MIRVLKQRGPGYWAKIYFPDGTIKTVQSPATYGFKTKIDARKAAENAARAILLSATQLEGKEGK